MENVVGSVQIALMGFAVLFVIFLFILLAMYCMRLILYESKSKKQTGREQESVIAAEDKTVFRKEADQAQDPGFIAAMTAAVAAFEDAKRPGSLVHLRAKVRQDNQAWKHATRLESIYRWRW